MPLRLSFPLRSADAWGRALATREAASDCAQDSAIRVQESALRLERTVERLNQSDPRVRRQRLRRLMRSDERVLG